MSTETESSSEVVRIKPSFLSLFFLAEIQKHNEGFYFKRKAIKEVSKPKAITDKGIMLFKDYEFLFNLMTDEEVGKVVKLLLLNFGKKYKHNPSDDIKVNSAFNYIANRINDYQEVAKKASINGLKGGNPTLKGEVKPTPEGQLNGEDKLIEGKGIEGNRREKIDPFCSQLVEDFIKLYSPVSKSIKTKAHRVMIAKALEQEPDLKVWAEVVEKLEGKGHKIDGEFRPVSLENVLKNHTKILEGAYNLETIIEPLQKKPHWTDNADITVD